MYNNCQWSASGELDCSQKSTYMGHQFQIADMAPYENYSGLNRELDVSVYTPNNRIETTYTRTTAPTPQQAQTQSLEQPSDTVNVQWGHIYTPSKKHKVTYYFQSPKQKLYELLSEFGQPSSICTSYGGVAIWLYPRNLEVFQRIDVVDETVFSQYPVPHVGFLYTYTKIKIPTTKLNLILNMSGDINYDINKHILIIRGMSISYNLSILYVICKYLNNKMSYYDIKQYDILKNATYHKKLNDPKIYRQHLTYVQKYIKIKNKNKNKNKNKKF